MNRAWFWLSVFIFIASVFEIYASNTDNDDFIPGYYFVSFSDKDYSPYNINNPEEFLSEASILRRTKFGISLNEQDLPLSPLYIDSVSNVVKILYASKWFNAVLVGIDSREYYDVINNFTFSGDVLFLKPFVLETKRETKTQQGDYFLNVYNPGLLSSVYNYKKSSISNEYGYMEEQIKLLNGQALNNLGYYGKGIPIALFDAGFKNVDTIAAFKHLWDSGRIVGFLDLVEDDEDVFDSHHHGTMVLSTMAAILPGQLQGAATQASYMLIRSEDVYSEYLIEEVNWLKAAEIADSAGIYIINSSLGYTEFDDPSQNHTYEDLDGSTTIIARAANYAHNRGMLVISSAGNYALRDWKYIGSPADSYGALAVGALKLDGERAAFSSVGPSPDGRVKPEVMAPGQNVYVVNSQGAPVTSSGTSFSAPILSSLAACLWEEFPDKSNEQIKNAIIKSSNQYMFPDSLYGYGTPDFAKARLLLTEEYQDKPNVLSIYPNPINQFSYINLFTENDSKANLMIYNISGQLVSENHIELRRGYNKVKPFQNIFPILSSGLYIIKINNGSDKLFVKAVKGY